MYYLTAQPWAQQPMSGYGPTPQFVPIPLPTPGYGSLPQFSPIPLPTPGYGTIPQTLPGPLPTPGVMPGPLPIPGVIPGPLPNPGRILPDPPMLVVAVSELTYLEQYKRQLEQQRDSLFGYAKQVEEAISSVSGRIAQLSAETSEHRKTQ